MQSHLSIHETEIVFQTIYFSSKHLERHRNFVSNKGLFSMIKNDMQRTDANTERRYNRCCRHPSLTSIGDRREIRYSLLFQTKISAINFGTYILGVRQRVQLFSCEIGSQFPWLVIVSPVMIPTHKNIDKYCSMLCLDANRYAGILLDEPIEVAPQEQVKKEDENVLWSLTFPTRDTSLKVGIDLLTHGKRVQAWKLRKQINRWEIAVSATMFPIIENIGGYEQKFAEYINAYGGKYECLGWHTYTDERMPPQIVNIS